MVGKLGKWGIILINGSEALLNMTLFHFTCVTALGWGICLLY